MLFSVLFLDVEESEGGRWDEVLTKSKSVVKTSHQLNFYLDSQRFQLHSFTIYHQLQLYRLKILNLGSRFTKSSTIDSHNRSSANMLQILCTGNPLSIGLQHGKTASLETSRSISFYESLFQRLSKLDWPAVTQLALKYQPCLSETGRSMCPRFKEWRKVQE